MADFEEKLKDICKSAGGEFKSHTTFVSCSIENTEIWMQKEGYASIDTSESEITFHRISSIHYDGDFKKIVIKRGGVVVEIDEDGSVDAEIN